MLSAEDTAFPGYDRDAYHRDVVEFDRLWARNTTPDERCRMDRLMARFERTTPAQSGLFWDRSVAVVC